ncbi:MAG: tRNA uridine-5-carboxymethylaminomethyl(34) synthesis GTPase MnmE [Spirochaetaceae bacterium]|nr:MAG: tRNA uridine-5-carboxymethylaminomethyl(34) synthesis GTPase MnmE [Spirochaetaceae bacterium]
MKESPFDTHDMIAALSTPLAASALAVIRTSGEGCIQALDMLFKGSHNLSDTPAGTIRHGWLSDPATADKIDEVVATVYRAPASYTGEDAVEISCHGSLPCITKILSALRNAGFRDAGPGEFTMRAFLNNKMDLTQAEAVNEIITATSDRGRILAMHRLSGLLSENIEQEKKKLVEALAGIEVMIDYPDEEYEHSNVAVSRLMETRARLESLAGTYRIGKTIQEGAVMAIAGRTNSGKSTLFNFLLKEERSIVSEYHGTTRDFIEAHITINGIPIRLFDTAGFRSSGQEVSSLHPVEAEGIRRTKNLLDQVQAVLYLVDSSVGITAEDHVFLEAHCKDARIIKIWNKADIQADKCPASFIAVSAATAVGLPALEQAVSELLLGKSANSADEVVIDSQRQKEALDRAVQATDRACKGITSKASYDLIACDLHEAVDSLGALTGEVTSALVLEAMFKNFCVGK